MAAVSVDCYWLASVQTNQFCVNTGLHGTDKAFDLTKYAGVDCGGSGSFDDLVALRTTGYSAGGNATLAAVMYDGE